MSLQDIDAFLKEPESASGLAAIDAFLTEPEAKPVQPMPASAGLDLGGEFPQVAAPPQVAAAPAVTGWTPTPTQVAPLPMPTLGEMVAPHAKMLDHSSQGMIDAMRGAPRKPTVLAPGNVARGELVPEVRTDRAPRSLPGRVADAALAPVGGAMYGIGGLASGVGAAEDVFLGQQNGPLETTLGTFGRGAKMLGRALRPDEESFVNDFMFGIGNAGSFFLPGLATARGAQFAGKFAPFLGAGASAGLESIASMDEIYRELVGRGEDPQAARDAASRVFFENLALLTLTNQLEPFAPGSGKVLGSALKASIGNFVEGAGQSISQQHHSAPSVMGSPTIDPQEVLRSGAMEAAVGGVIGGGVRLAERQAPSRPIADLFQEELQAKEAAAAPKPAMPSGVPGMPMPEPLRAFADTKRAKMLERVPADHPVTPQGMSVVDRAFSDPEYVAAYDAVEKMGSSTDAYMKDQVTGTIQYPPEIQAYHNAVAETMFVDAPASLPQAGESPRFVILIGPSASGKSTTLEKILPEARRAHKKGPGAFVRGDADAIKELMPGYTPEKAAFYQKESADILEKIVLPRAMAEGRNVVFDGVGRSHGKLLDWLEEAKGHGYEVELYQMHVDDHVAADRAYRRWQGEDGVRGRLVPVDYVLVDVDGRPDATYDIIKASGKVKRGRRYDNTAEGKGLDAVVTDEFGDFGSGSVQRPAERRRPGSHVARDEQGATAEGDARRAPERRAPGAVTSPAREARPNATPARGVGEAGDLEALETPSGSKYQTRYVVRSLSEVRPSHNAHTFSPDQDYEPEIQNRPYHSDPNEQAKVTKQGAKFNPRYMLIPSPKAQGLPILSEKATNGKRDVLSGNSRTMSLMRAFQDGAKYDEYFELLRLRAPMFGIDPTTLRKEDMPVLFKEVVGLPDTREARRRLARETNETFTQALNAEAEAVSRGNALSPRTLEWISESMAANDGASLRDFLRSGKDGEIVKRFITDGVVSQRDISRYVDAKTGLLNGAGKRLVEDTILGAAIPDSDLLQTAPDAAVDKVVRSLGAISKLRATGGEWDLSADLVRALRTVTEMRARGMSDIRILRAQATIGDEAKPSPRSDRLAEAMARLSPNSFKSRMDSFAAEADHASNEQEGLGGIGRERLTPTQALDKAFGRIPPGRSNKSGMRVAEESAPYLGTNDPNLGTVHEALQLAFEIPETPLKVRGRSKRAAPGRTVTQSGVVTIANGVTEELANTKRVDFRGQTVETARDLAVIGQILRHPGFEKLSVFYMRGKEIVGHETMTSREVTSSPAWIEGHSQMSRSAETMRRRMERLGADGYYVMHNHPSGDPSPSAADFNVTFMMGNLVRGFRGHVVINSGKYAVIPPETVKIIRQELLHAEDVTDAMRDVARGKLPLSSVYTREALALQVYVADKLSKKGDAVKVLELGTDKLLTPSVPHQTLGRKIATPGDIASIASELKTPENYVTIIYTSAEGKVRAVQQMPLTLFTNHGEAANWIRGFARKVGGARVFSYYEGNRSAEVRRAADTLIAPLSTLDDHVMQHGERLSSRQSAGIRPSAIVERGRLKNTGYRSTPGGRMDGITQANQVVAPYTGAPPTGGLADLDAMQRAAPSRGLGERLTNAKDRLYETQVNKFHPLKALTKAYEGLGRTFRDGESPVEKVELVKNATNGQIEAFAIKIGRIFREAHDGGLEGDLNKYLLLKQFEKRIRDLSSNPANNVTPAGRRTAPGGQTLLTGQFINPREFDLPKVQGTITELENKLGPNKMDEVRRLAARVWELNRGLLDQAHAAGIVSTDVYQELIGRGQDYVPIQVLDYINEAGDHKVSARHKPYNVRYQDFLRRQQGTERDVENALHASMDKAIKTISTINRNLAAKAVTDLHRYMPAVIERVAGDTFTVAGDKEVISVFENGERGNYAVPPDIARALNFLDADQIGLVGKVLSYGRAPLQAGATGANLAFAIPNLVRDTKRAAVYSKWGIRTPADLVTFPLDWFRGLAHVLKKDALYMDFLESGAAFGTIQKALTPEQFIRRAAGLDRGVIQKVNLPGIALDLTRRANSALEEATKMQTFIRGRRAGARPAEVAYETANYGGSPNFGRNGSWTQSLNLVFMFYNARLQGTDANVRRLTDDPGVAARSAGLRIFMYMVLPAMALYAYNAQYDDDYGIEEVPRSDRQRYHIILLPETYQAADGTTRRRYLKIAKEETEGVVSAIIEGSFDWAAGKDTSFKKGLLDLAGNVAPISFDVKGADPGLKDVAKGVGAGLVSSANPLIRVPYEVTADYNTRGQHALTPRGLADNVRPEDQAKPTTSYTMQRLGRILGMSPIKLEHAVTSSTGGLGQSALGALDLAQGKTAPETMTGWEKSGRLPFLSRVVGTGGDQVDRDTEERFYRAMDRSKRDIGSMTAAADTLNKDRFGELAEDPRTMTSVMVREGLDEMGRELAEIRKLQAFVTHTLQDNDTDQKRVALKYLAERRASILDAFRKVEAATTRSAPRR